MPNHTVLIVDDDPDHRVITSTILKHHGYDVIETDSGERGIELALEHRPAVVVMDVRLPGMDGYMATHRLKVDPRTAAIPIIILTAQALEEDRLKSAAAGADGYLSKPCEPALILQEVERHLAAAMIDGRAKKAAAVQQAGIARRAG